MIFYNIIINLKSCGMGETYHLYYCVLNATQLLNLITSIIKLSKSVLINHITTGT